MWLRRHIDENACKLFEDNFGIKPDNRDIREVSSDELPDFDILTGGFPCQSFSVVAQNPKRLGIKDDRGILFFEMCRILREKQPMCFIAENVKGILSANKKEAFPLIIEEFEKSGYSVTYSILNSVKCGVPQKRERVIIVGFRKDLNITFDFSGIPERNEEDYVPLKDVIDSVVDEKYFFSERAVQGMMKKRATMNKGRAQDITKPCNTVGSHLAKVSLNSTDPVLLVNGRYRRFTPREVARIQSFPDTFKLNSVSQGRQYKAIGNAVPPVMMWHIIKALQKVFVVKQLDFLKTLEKYPNNIVERSSSHNNEIDSSTREFDKSKNVLISYVKSDNIDLFLDRSARVYYTGKKFPSTVALNKLYYFMPYFKGKGIRDLYLIKIARIGTRKEGQPNNDPNDLRLVFEIVFLFQLFDDYKLINLEIWRTFTDTNMTDLFSKIKK